MCAASQSADPLSPGDDLCHPALIYDAPDEFLVSAVSFVQDGLDAGERVLVVTSQRNLDGLGAALAPGDAAAIDVHASDTFLATPWRALVAYRRWIDRHTAAGARVRVIGEPFAPPRTAPEAIEWTRYEALLNVAFAGLPLTILCPYDAGLLDPWIVAHAHCTHPQLLSLDGGLSDSPEYTDPHLLSAALDRTGLVSPRPPLVEHRLARGDALGELRRFVADQAGAAGLGHDRAADLAFAAHEIAVNAREHGGGRAVARTWTADGELLCEIVDTGSGMADPLAGTVEPATTQPSGRGLWLARQLCDLVQVRSGATGTVVRLHMALG